MTQDSVNSTSPIAGGPDVVDRHAIQVTSLRKTFRRHKGGGSVTPIDDVSFTVVPGEMLVLLGPSGCGKTTLLRSIAGLERPDEGRIEISGETVFDAAGGVFIPPNKRTVGMIFQSYALWPHMDVKKNISYPLKARRYSRDEIDRRVAHAVERVGLSGLLDQYPGQLSGGQQQRVALARALVTEADVILFDEPLSNVDAKVREQLRAELVHMQRELGFTALYVTHDQTEAMELADRIAVLDRGRIEQLAAPIKIYQSPRSRYVADFIGAANVIPAVVDELEPEAVIVTTDIGKVRAKPPREEWHGGELEAGMHVYVMMRPEDFNIGTKTTAPCNSWEVDVERVTYTGIHSHYLTTLSGVLLRIWGSSSRGIVAEGSKAWIDIPINNVHLLPPVHSIAHGEEDPDDFRH